MESPITVIKRKAYCASTGAMVAGDSNYQTDPTNIEKTFSDTKITYDWLETVKSWKNCSPNTCIWKGLDAEDKDMTLPT